MVDEKAFNATKDAFWQYGLYFKEVAAEYGLEKAMNLHSKAMKSYGEEVTKAIKDSVSERVDLKAMASFFEGGLNATGWDTRMVVEGPRSIVLRHSRCPEAEGLLQAGLDPKTVEAHCRRTLETVSPILRRLVPGMRMSVRKWNAPKSCDEELVIE
jgi:hypothetical protein